MSSPAQLQPADCLTPAITCRVGQPSELSLEFDVDYLTKHKAQAQEARSSHRAEHIYTRSQTKDNPAAKDGAMTKGSQTHLRVAVQVEHLQLPQLRQSHL